MRFRDIWVDLLPSNVSIAECGIDRMRGPDREADRALLIGGENELADGFGDLRLSHFAAGRSCARKALRALGQPKPVEVLADDGRPHWPAGVIGSISHTVDYCVAAVAARGSLVSLGIDVERVDRLSEPVAKRIAVPGELEALPGAPLEWAPVVFSAKEAFYKLQHPVTDTFLGFRGARVTVEPSGMLEVELLADIGPFKAGNRFAGRFARTEFHVFTALALPAGS